METLGTRIRKIRKERKLTLAELAGDRLTKGMLSLIENDKANPSMDSLAYIAEQLEIEVSELLEEVSTSELRELLEKVKSIKVPKLLEAIDPQLERLQLIEPYIDRLPISYEAGQLLVLYAEAKYDVEKQHWEEPLDRAIHTFKKMNLMNDWLRAFILKSSAVFINHNYEESLNILLAAKKDMELNHYVIDELPNLDLLYMIAVEYLAIGMDEEGFGVMNEAIKLSKEARIFYRIDDLYRLAAFKEMMYGNEQDLQYYLKKLSQYADFTDDVTTKGFILFAKAHFYNSFLKDYEKGNEFAEQFYNFDAGEGNKTMAFYYIEKGKSLFGMKRYSEALEAFEQIDGFPKIHHPYDLSMQNELHAYKALCYEQQGQLAKALEEAKIGVDIVEHFIDTPYKQFINNTYEKLKKKADGR
ncbi:helix-turn-helix transcriptional regulator [Viridibacillus sp. FSL R5-0477]|uniref:DNA-binding protein n=1 Tax=Viridibacillus arenosi FSL R5-213 TaxID=1227360 RepID=W4EQI2_9BACL|nr:MULTISPECIES: helix-turn-helix transcriptional regulator [Viridibacillus]ETT82855.1 DNA-binding protein [Viridibacillus arenosi FSL R5-213]OMC82195.1 transcriptional regulator [Viridibacillus sp. FSL H8-0123]OMC86352.1 transcriptional regulator [Viridibacillus sp. FSL H7-0596]OMC90744.1 transcriptional regulator [Viridibacillus arenosi]